jgi:glycosyltransferase involved in cell wall biosynthesis
MVLSRTMIDTIKRPIIYVHLSRNLDSDQYRERYLAGLEPDETPYGFHLAKSYDFELLFSTHSPSWITSLLSKVCQKLLGFDVPHAYRNRAKIRQAEAVWTMTESESFAVAILSRLGISPKLPLVANVIWLFDRWQTISWSKRIIYKILAREISVITVHSDRCLPQAKLIFPNTTCELMHFGVNTDLFNKKESQHVGTNKVTQIFAPGNDSTRDWATLLKAFGNDKRFHVTIICSHLSDTLLMNYSNLSLVRNPTINEFLTRYREADIVVVPMVDNIFSGITVALEAVALGKPVLATRTGGLLTYFTEDELLYVPIGDAETMLNSVIETSHDDRQRQAARAYLRFQKSDYSTRAMIGRYVAITQRFIQSS